MKRGSLGQTSPLNSPRCGGSERGFSFVWAPCHFVEVSYDNVLRRDLPVTPGELEGRVCVSLQIWKGGQISYLSCVCGGGGAQSKAESQKHRRSTCIINMDNQPPPRSMAPSQSLLRTLRQLKNKIQFCLRYKNGLKTIQIAVRLKNVFGGG